ncbi:MAG TPA: hypothetical protein VH105_25425 [Burkholderiales bacterium]|nr:hypothetical protein [Burkholderiales bacterium]
MDAPQTAQQELRRLLEEGDDARRALIRLEAERARLQAQLAAAEARVEHLQSGLGLAERLRVQEDYLAAQLRRLDGEIGAAPAGRPPGGIERRATPRPETIRMPVIPEEPPPAPGVTGKFIDRARRALRKEKAARQEAGVQRN